MESIVATLLTERLFETMPGSLTSDGSAKIYDVRETASDALTTDRIFGRFVDGEALREPSEEELHLADGTTLVRRLPTKLRRLPTELLYDAEGLALFEKITLLDDAYYLTGAERDILFHQMHEIATHIPNNASVIELGCGSMAKTAIILDHLQRTGREGISFYALDIEASSLKSSLANLMAEEERKHLPPKSAIRYAGILGTYDEALTSFLHRIPGPRVFLWLGSSIGNCPTREEAAAFMRRFQEVMQGDDLFLLGVDRRNDPSVVALAYNDPFGISAEFGLNGLRHVNRLMGAELFDVKKFEYFAGYNAKEGRHEAYYRSLERQVLTVPCGGKQVEVELGLDELVRYELSYKYSEREVEQLAEASGLQVKETWFDRQNLYRLCLLEKKLSFSGALGRSALPTRQELRDSWSQWDRVTGPDVIGDFLDQPIHLRHPVIFYVGHLPAFCDILLSRCLGEPLTEPVHFKDIFERGIDPVVEDPSICHPHSDVPDTWPSREEILEYAQRVRKRVLDVCDALDCGQTHVPPRRVARTLHMILEHELMHLETFMYMLAQSDKINLPFEISASVAFIPQLDPPEWIEIEGGAVSVGMVDPEDGDYDGGSTDGVFGWDNESPQRRAAVPSFRLQQRPVSNLEYLRFLKLQPTVSPDLIPASFSGFGESCGVRTVSGIVPMAQCLNWPVALNYHQALAYMKDLQISQRDDTIHIPSEEELLRFYDLYAPRIVDSAQLNVGFKNWHPTAATGLHVFGSLWEWTSTELERHDGFVASELYPGYTRDFFDGKHNVVKGGSWATHPRMVGRLRNFYQRSYPFAFIGVRFASSKMGPLSVEQDVCEK